jgi:methionyl-tRNA formyltransferase
VDRGVDTGPVIARSSFDVDPSWNAGDLAERADAVGLDLLVRTVTEWAASGPPEATAQAEEGVTLAPRPDDDLLEIRWSWPARRIARLVRAAAPDPGAFSELDGRELVVLAARPVDPPLPLEPGEAVRLDSGVVVGTGDGGLLLETIRLDDGPELRGRAVVAALDRMLR